MKQSSPNQEIVPVKKQRLLPDTDWLIFAIVVFEVTAFGMLSLRGDTLDPWALVLSMALPLILCLQSFFLAKYFPYMDRYLFVMAHFLCGLGIIVLFRLGPAKGLKQFSSYAVGCVGQIFALLAIVKGKHWWRLRYVIMGGSVLLLVAALVLGKEKFGATNWINIGGFSMQPSEFVKIAVPIVLALYLSRMQKLKSLLPAGIFVVVCVLLLVVQKDLGAVLIYFCAAIFLYYVATSDWVITLLGVAGAAAGSIFSYFRFDHVRIRVAVWKNPWATVDSTGYQMVQSLMAISSGGFFGMGLGQGLPRSIPVYDSDFIFAVICEEFGTIMGMCVLILYVLILLRGAMLAIKSRDAFSSLLAFGVTCVLAVQTFLIVGGVINMIPLTGVTLPFISSGGSSMVACLAMVGILQGLAINHGEGEAKAWKRAREQLRAREVET